MILSAVRDPYPTRDKSEGALIRRTEPVVHSPWSDDAPLSEQQFEHFEKKGYLVLTDVFSSHELNELRATAERASRTCIESHRGQVILEPSSEQFRTLFGIHDMPGLFAQTARHAQLLQIMQFLLNDEVYIHQSRMNFKNALYGSGFEWHSDFETWHAEDGMPGMRAVSATILLTDELPGDGSLKLMPGSHKTFLACPGETPDNSFDQRLRKQSVGKPPAMLLDLLEESCGIEEMVAPAGSVVLFDCNLMHGAGKNTSEHLRANLFYVYNAVSNSLANPYSADSTRPEFVASRLGQDEKVLELA